MSVCVRVIHQKSTRTEIGQSTECLSRVSQLLKHQIELSQDAANERTEEDKRVERPIERETDDSYCRWNNFLCDLIKDSKTTSRKIDHAEAKLQAVKKDIDAMTLAIFHLHTKSPPVDGPIMDGFYGDNSPQKARKQGSGGL